MRFFPALSPMVAALAALLTLTGVALAPAQSGGSEKAPQIVVNVFGEVKVPGRYTLPSGATLLDAFAAAVGQTVDADLKRVRFIHAVRGDQPVAERIDLRAMLTGVRAAPTLHVGVSLNVPRQFISVVY